MNSLNQNLLLTIALVCCMAACTENLTISPVNSTSEIGTGSGTQNALAGALENQRNCSAVDVLNENAKEDKDLLKRMDDVEKHADKFKKGKGKVGATPQELAIANSLLDATTINIPVVVNVLYSKPAENVSDAQIASQIDILNADFNATNIDVANLATTSFSGKASNFNIRFVLAKTVRKASTTAAWGTRDAMKKSKSGGIDPTNAAYYLNIWVCEIGGTLLGYAQFPGGRLLKLVPVKPPGCKV